MDATNKIVNEQVNIYGLCDKQLACTTCSVVIEDKNEALEAPTEEELDILLGIKEDSTSKSGQLRMACQIHLTPEMDGMVVRIPNNK
jgi:ferredoxin